MIEIEKNIPMPNRNERRKKYPLEIMEKGDSFSLKQKKKK